LGVATQLAHHAELRPGVQFIEFIKSCDSTADPGEKQISIAVVPHLRCRRIKRFVALL